MKRTILLLTALCLALSACTLPSLAVASPTPTETPLPSATPLPSNTPTDTPIPSDTPTPTETLPPSETPTPSDTPTFTATPTLPPFDPGAEYGASPTLYDSMDTDRNWADSGGLPNDDLLRLALGSGQLHVTGKQPNFDTWWFTSPAPNDFFLQMTVETETCSGRQAYGFILRGPQTIGASARGYVYTFSCDGAYRLDRLERTSPYTLIELIDWTDNDYIQPGSNETNVIGVRMIGDVITLYANGFEIDEIEDGNFAGGRFGLFVNAGDPGNFTYKIDELSYWRLD